MPSSDTKGALPAWASAHTSSTSIGPSSKSKSSGGSWQGLGVDPKLAKGLSLRGFKTPTPIQRTTLPSTLASPPRDVLGMARTGSGKTLAYIIPLLQLLNRRPVTPKRPRAMILCPTRELALQVLKVGKDLGRGFAKDRGDGNPIRWALIMGGDALDKQFEAMSSQPDVVIATPGRLLHVLVEMNADLKGLEMVIYDEADRLFEMGFEAQLHEILHRLPTNRQSLLFSATLPAAVAEFAKAGLVNPLLLRLDADTKISDDLKMSFFEVKATMKDAALLAILEATIGITTFPSQTDQHAQAIIFVSTKHHVEYLVVLLQAAGYRTNHIYGSLDQIARQTQLAGFRNKDADLLVVTDVAARGLDIPVMDNVVNYDFPTGVRTFVHRVGRTARAGRKGSAWTLVTKDDMPYLVDLEHSLGMDLIGASAERLWSIPQQVTDLQIEQITSLDEIAQDLPTLRAVMSRGTAMFQRSRSKASTHGHRNAKEFHQSQLRPPTHPSFPLVDSFDQMNARDRLLSTLQAFQPEETVFEMGKRGENGNASLMHARRDLLRKRSQKAPPRESLSDASDDEAIATLLHTRQDKFRDPEHFLHHQRQSSSRDQGYSIKDPNFVDQIHSATFDMNQDEGSALRQDRPSQLKWDRKKKRMVKNEVGADNKKMIRSESGALLPASYKSGRYEEWRRGHRRGDNANATSVDSHSNTSKRQPSFTKSQSEIKSTGVIVRNRRTVAQRKAKNHRQPRRK